jgi:AcrR family transcriptional regulator
MTERKSRIQQRIEHDLIISDEIILTEEMRRGRILSAAIQECAEVGYKAAGIANVAKRARVSTATLYRYFNDKTDLFVQAVAYVVHLLGDAITLPILDDDPVVRVKKMLIAHGAAIGDPFLTWLYRLYVSSDNDKNAPTMALVARAGRTLTEQHWQAHVMSLEKEGYLRPAPYATTINLLLGQVERRTILWNLLFGQEEGADARLDEVADFAAVGLFANLGTERFFQDHPHHRPDPRFRLEKGQA